MHDTDHCLIKHKKGGEESTDPAMLSRGRLSASFKKSETMLPLKQQQCFRAIHQREYFARQAGSTVELLRQTLEHMA